jgi:predicted  nucleic acid-binding Zn-ribbon protein
MQIQTEKRTLMNDTPFSAFINLISFDQEIRALNAITTKLKKESDLLLTQKQELSTRLHQFKQHLYELRKTVEEQECYLKELDAQERTKKEQMDLLRDNRQYQLFKKEIDRLKQEQHEKENYLMMAWNKFDIAQKEFEEHQTSHTKKLEELTENLSSIQHQIEQNSAQLELKKQERPFKEIGIPNEWLEKYTLMRLRVDDPVVPTTFGGCSACSYAVTEQELIRLKRKALIQCKGCFRLLYMQEAMKTDIANSQANV